MGEGKGAMKRLRRTLTLTPGDWFEIEHALRAMAQTCRWNLGHEPASRGLPAWYWRMSEAEMKRNARVRLGRVRKLARLVAPPRHLLRAA